MTRKRNTHEKEDPGLDGASWGKVNPKSRLRRAFRPLGKGSLRACILTLMAAAIGPGAMLLPFMFRLVGIPVGLFCLVFGAYCSTQSMRFIISIVYLTGRDSYPAAVSAILGPTAGSALMHLTTFNLVLGISSQVKYLAALLEVAPVPSLLPAAPLELAVVVAVFPMCVRRDISALRHVTVVAPLALLYVLVMVLIRGFGTTQAQGLDRPEPAMHLDLLRSGVAGLRGVPQAFSIVVNAMTCHHLAVPVYRELHCAKAQRVNKVVLRCMSYISILYGMVGCSAFLTFGRSTPENILLAYPQGDKAAFLAQLLVGCTLYVATPLNVHALRGHLMENLPGPAVSLLGHSGQTVQAASTTLLLGLPGGISYAFPDVAALVGVAVGFGLVAYLFVLPAAALCAIRWGRWGARHGVGSGEHLQDLLLSSPLSTPLLSARHGSMVSPSPPSSPKSGSCTELVGLDDPELVELPPLQLPRAAAEEGAAVGGSVLSLQGLPAEPPPELCLASQGSTPTSRRQLWSPSSRGSWSPSQSEDGRAADEAQWSSEFSLSLLFLAFGSGLGFAAAFGALAQCAAGGA